TPLITVDHCARVTSGPEAPLTSSSQPSSSTFATRFMASLQNQPHLPEVTTISMPSGSFSNVVWSKVGFTALPVWAGANLCRAISEPSGNPPELAMISNFQCPACFGGCLIATPQASMDQPSIRMCAWRRGFFPLLNELFALSSSLAKRELQVPTRHAWIKPFKKGEAIVAELDEAGTLARVSVLSAEEVASLRNIAPDNQKSFPGFNLNCPVLALSDTALWNRPEALWEDALAATLESPLAYQSKDLRRLNRLLYDFPL